MIKIHLNHFALKSIIGTAVTCSVLMGNLPDVAIANDIAAPAAQANCIPSAITTASVNFRTGPSTNYPIITVLPAHVLLAVTGRNADRSWYQVVFNGVQGWVSASYLRTTCVQGVPVIITPLVLATSAHPRRKALKPHADTHDAAHSTPAC